MLAMSLETNLLEIDQVFRDAGSNSRGSDRSSRGPHGAVDPPVTQDAVPFQPGDRLIDAIGCIDSQSRSPRGARAPLAALPTAWRRGILF